MALVDIIEATKSGLAQAFGESYADETGELTATNSGALVSLGQKITNNTQLQELFINGAVGYLLGVPSRVEVEANVYQADELASIDIAGDEYGAFMARIYFEPTENLFRDPSFNPQNGVDYSQGEHTYYGAKFEERVFTDSYDLLGAMSYSEQELLQAFRGWDEMNAFLTGKMAVMENTLKARKLVWRHALVQGAIALSVKNGTARHLLTEYNNLATTTAPLSKEQALRDKDFLSYVAEQIDNDKAYIRGFSSAFNNGNHVTFSERVRMHLLKFMESRIRYGLRADTFNERLLSFGDYDTVNYWQGIVDVDSNTYDFDTVSSVWLDTASCTKYGITEDTEGEGKLFENCIALIEDFRGVGLATRREYANSSVTANASFRTTFKHILAQGVVDDQYPIIAYFID